MGLGLVPGLQVNGTKLGKLTMVEVRCCACACTEKPPAESCLQNGKIQANGMEAGLSKVLCNVGVFRCGM